MSLSAIEEHEMKLERPTQRRHLRQEMAAGEMVRLRGVLDDGSALHVNCTVKRSNRTAAREPAVPSSTPAAAVRLGCLAKPSQRLEGVKSRGVQDVFKDLKFQ